MITSNKNSIFTNKSDKYKIWNYNTIPISLFKYSTNILFALFPSEGGGGPLRLLCPVNFMNVRRRLRSSGRPTVLWILM